MSSIYLISKCNPLDIYSPINRCPYVQWNLHLCSYTYVLIILKSCLLYMCIFVLTIIHSLYSCHQSFRLRGCLIVVDWVSSDWVRRQTGSNLRLSGPSPTSKAPTKHLGPRTESDIKGKKMSLRFLSPDRVWGKMSDPGPSLTSKERYQTLGPRTESESARTGLSLHQIKQPLSLDP